MKFNRWIAILFMLAGIYTNPVNAASLLVGKSQQYKLIQLAINAAKTGDTILVSPGVYKEQTIVINKTIFLIGIQYPIIDGEHTYQIMSIKANNVLVKGFKLMHSGTSSLIDIAGIKVYDAKNVVIEDNFLEDTFFGIFLQGATNCTIKNNSLKAYAKTDQQSANGIHCWKCDSLYIIGNTVTGHRDGIYFEFVTHSLIWRNRSFKNSRYGLHFMFSHNDAYIGNIFQKNSAGVSVMFTHGVKMFNNVFEDNWGDGCYGIFLKEITDSHISGNTFLRNTTGIFFEGATRIVVEKNTFIKNGWAAKIQANSIQNTISNNNFLANSFDIATNGSLVENTFNKNYWDKYEGYDLNKDGFGDVPYHPVSMFSMIVAENPTAMILFRSFMATLFDKTEKILPSLTPENLVDKLPYMKPLRL